MKKLASLRISVVPYSEFGCRIRMETQYINTSCRYTIYQQHGLNIIIGAPSNYIHPRTIDLTVHASFSGGSAQEDFTSIRPMTMIRSFSPTWFFNH